MYRERRPCLETEHRGGPLRYNGEQDRSWAHIICMHVLDRARLRDQGGSIINLKSVGDFPIPTPFALARNDEHSQSVEDNY